MFSSSDPGRPVGRREQSVDLAAGQVGHEGSVSALAGQPLGEPGLQGEGDLGHGNSLVGGVSSRPAARARSSGEAEGLGVATRLRGVPQNGRPYRRVRALTSAHYVHKKPLIAAISPAIGVLAPPRGATPAMTPREGRGPVAGAHA
jgi:hypothetical protein